MLAEKEQSKNNNKNVKILANSVVSHRYSVENAQILGCIEMRVRFPSPAPLIIKELRKSAVEMQ
jgi:hypothetical protein